MRILFLLLSILCFAVSVLANQKELLQLDSAFANGDYEKVELLALRILRSPDSLPDVDRARVNLTVGYAMILLGHEQDARGYFKQALNAVPDLTLDPVLVSPKFKVIFDDVKTSHLRTIEKAEAKLAGSREHYPSRKAMLYNLVVPGSGQIVEGQKLRGVLFTTAQLASVVWLVTSLNKVHDSRSNYLRATDTAEISKAYTTYNQDHKTAWAAGILTGVIYLAAQTDLILYKPHEKVPVILSFENQAGFGLSVRW